MNIWTISTAMVSVAYLGCLQQLGTEWLGPELFPKLPLTSQSSFEGLLNKASPFGCNKSSQLLFDTKF